MPKVFFLLLFVAKITLAQVSIKRYGIGNTTIQVQTTLFAPLSNGIYFINLHSNETTSIESCRQYLQAKGGMLFQLLNNENRYVHFKCKDGNYTIDPNRIFTTEGRAETLKKNSTYTIEAARETKQFADSILSLMKMPKLIIAMHNNTDKGFSVNSYLKSENEAINALDIYVNKQMDTDDFVYTTELKVFSYLKQQQINVVLQKTMGFKDDGSLSIYCSRKNIPYINIEAEEGHKAEQLKILDALTAIISSYEAK